MHQNNAWLHFSWNMKKKYLGLGFRYWKAMIDYKLYTNSKIKINQKNWTLWHYVLQTVGEHQTIAKSYLISNTNYEKSLIIQGWEEAQKSQLV